MNRTRGYYRYQRDRAIRNKYRKRQSLLGKKATREFYDFENNHIGELSKGKIHCSCPMCRVKSYDELSHRDKLMMERSNYDLEMVQ